MEQSVQYSKPAVMLLAFRLAPVYTGSIALIYILFKAKYWTKWQFYHYVLCTLFA